MLHYLTQTRINIYLTILQIVVSGVTFFLLYRYLYQAIGAEKIGLWSLVIAFASAARLGELGLAGGVVKFVAEARATNNDVLAARIIQTVLITLTVVLVALAYPAFQLFSFGLDLLLDDLFYSLGIEILPYTLLSISMMVGVAVISGAMDGYMLMGVRNLILTFSHIIYLGLVTIFVPLHDVLGIAYAQCIQYLFLFTTLWALMKIRVRELPWLPCVFDFWVLNSMLRYGVTFQTMTVVNMFFEPLIKVSMTHWGGLSALGLYEMANKFALQIRSIVVESNRVIVPIIAGKNNDSDGAFERRNLVHKSFRVVLFSSICLFGLMLIGAPIVSLIWLGEINVLFLSILIIVSSAWAFNTLIGPVYFSNLATGVLKHNLLSHCITCLLGILLSNGLGYWFGAFGVTFAASFSIIIGSLYLLIDYYRKNSPFEDVIFIPVPFYYLTIVMILGVMMSFQSSTSGAEVSNISIVLGLLSISVPICGVCFFQLRKGGMLW